MRFLLAEESAVPRFARHIPTKGYGVPNPLAEAVTILLGTVRVGISVWITRAYDQTDAQKSTTYQRKHDQLPSLVWEAETL